MTQKNLVIPSDVPYTMRDIFAERLMLLTHGTNRIVIFSGDQKIEHLHKDFCGPEIDPADASPRHLFQIASQARIGGFAAQLGLIARYAAEYEGINYIVKLNSKTNIIPAAQSDPISEQLWTVDDVLELQENITDPIVGIGYTVYLGSEYESAMLAQAAESIIQAHRNGLVAILWMYPRGKAVKNEREGDLIAGAAGVANALGADVAKINLPQETSKESSYELLARAAQAAGNTKLIISGGSQADEKEYLEMLYRVIHEGHCSGTATGRNIHQRSLNDALILTEKIARIVYDNEEHDVNT